MSIPKPPLNPLSHLLYLSAQFNKQLGLEVIRLIRLEIYVRLCMSQHSHQLVPHLLVQLRVPARELLQTQLQLALRLRIDQVMQTLRPQQVQLAIQVGALRELSLS